MAGGRKTAVGGAVVGAAPPRTRVEQKLRRARSGVHCLTCEEMRLLTRLELFHEENGGPNLTVDVCRHYVSITNLDCCLCAWSESSHLL